MSIRPHPFFSHLLSRAIPFLKCWWNDSNSHWHLSSIYIEIAFPHWHLSWIHIEIAGSCCMIFICIHEFIVDQIRLFAETWRRYLSKHLFELKVHDMCNSVCVWHGSSSKYFCMSSHNSRFLNVHSLFLYEFKDLFRLCSFVPHKIMKLWRLAKNLQRRFYSGWSAFLKAYKPFCSPIDFSKIPATTIRSTTAICCLQSIGCVRVPPH